MLLKWPGYFYHLVLHPNLTLFNSHLDWGSRVQRTPVRCAQLKQPSRGSSWCDVDAFNTSSSAAKVQWHKDTMSLAKHSRQELKIFFPPWTEQTDAEEMPQEAFLETTGGHKCTQGSGQFPPLRAAQREGEGKAGGNPAIVLAQTCRRWMHENKFDAEQKRILFNRKIDLHNHTICIPPNPSPSATSVNSHPQPNQTEQQQPQE